jgi:hypothetical protein
MNFMNGQTAFDNAPNMGGAFMMSSYMPPEQNWDITNFHSEEDIAGDQNADTASALDEMAYDRLTVTRYERMMANIESMMNSYDYQAAAQELVNINIGDLPLGVFDRFADALDKTSTQLADTDTYLNAQMASQSLTVYAVQDTIAQSAVFFIEETQSPLISVNQFLQELNIDETPPFPVLEFSEYDMGYGIADAYNPQLNANTAVLANFMANETTANNRQAALDNHGVAGQHAYNYDLKPF